MLRLKIVFPLIVTLGWRNLFGKTPPRRPLLSHSQSTSRLRTAQLNIEEGKRVFAVFDLNICLYIFFYFAGFRKLIFYQSWIYWYFLTQNFLRNPKLLFFVRFKQKFSEKIGFQDRKGIICFFVAEHIQKWVSGTASDNTIHLTLHAINIY